MAYSPSRGATPAFDQLTTEERSQLLGRLLDAHPQLVAESEDLALGLLSDVDPDEVAERIEWALEEADVDQLAYRAGRVRGRGYVHENEASSEILEELLQPELDDLARRAALGLHDAALHIALGLLRGLANCAEDVEEGTLLAYAGADVTEDLAWSVRDAAAKANLELPDELFDELSDELSEGL